MLQDRMADNTTVRARRRDAVLNPICEELLANGLDAANLRSLAKAAGTSDRMLLYYFADKNELIAAALDRLAERLSAALEERTPTEPMPRDALADAVWAAVCAPDLWQFMVLFVELAVRGARTGEPFAPAARSIMDRMRSWAGAHLDIADDEERIKAADHVIATVDGWVLLRLAKGTDD